MIAVAIDGPAGAGKSTVSRRVAKELGYIYVDTGALYRAIGLYMLERGVDPKFAEDVAAALAESAPEVDLAFREDGQHVLLSGRDVTDKIRTPAVSMAASHVSACLLYTSRCV